MTAPTPDTCPQCGGPLTQEEVDDGDRVYRRGPFGCDPCEWLPGNPVLDAETAIALAEDDDDCDPPGAGEDVFERQMRAAYPERSK